MTKLPNDWNQHYANKFTPWDSGKPSKELQRVLGEGWIKSGRVLELGCGTGTNAVYLAQQGFEVTASDVSPLAIAQARQKALAAGVQVDFQVADALQPPDFGAPFPFIFDRGVYHVLRCVNVNAYLETLKRFSAPGGHYLTLAGNANDSAAGEKGPPRVQAVEICQELGRVFQIVQLREFRFDGVILEGRVFEPLAWSVLVQRQLNWHKPYRSFKNCH